MSPPLRVFSFLCAGTPLKGDLPKGGGLETFINLQREVVVSLDLVCNNKKIGNKNKNKTKNTFAHNLDDHVQHGAVMENDARSIGAAVGVGGKRVAGRAGEARLGLEQFRNDHIGKVASVSNEN